MRILNWLKYGKVIIGLLIICAVFALYFYSLANLLVTLIVIIMQ